MNAQAVSGGDADTVPSETLDLIHGKIGSREELDPLV
jgi:hypothetical protein